jgi:hypothetical protein
MNPFFDDDFDDLAGPGDLGGPGGFGSRFGCSSRFVFINIYR